MAYTAFTKRAAPVQSGQNQNREGSGVHRRHRDPDLDELVTSEHADQLRNDVELIEGVYEP